MRKFKFMPKAIVGMMALAMTFGSVSGVAFRQPVAVYAETSDPAPAQPTQTPTTIIRGEGVPFIVELDEDAAVEETLSVSVLDEKGLPIENPDVKWTMTGQAKGGTTLTAAGVLTIDKDETATELKVTATCDKIKKEFTILVGTGAYLDVDYPSMTGTIRTNGDDKFLFLEVVKKKDDTKQGTIYCYTVEEARRIDLSFLKVSKEVFVRVYGDANPTYLTTYELAKQAKKPSMKYVQGQTGDDWFLKSFEINKTPLKKEDVKNYQWRTQYGEAWMPFSTLEEVFSMLSVGGANIFVREVSDDAPVTAESKVAIKAAAKAPKITVDYAKNSIKMKAGYEIRVPAWEDLPVEGKNAAGAAEIQYEPYYYKVPADKAVISPAALAELLVKDYVAQYNTHVDAIKDTSLTKPDKLTVDDVKDTDGNVTTKSDQTTRIEEMAEGYTMLVRVAADSEKKKAASQPAFVVVKKAPEIAVREEQKGEGESVTWEKKDVIVVIDSRDDDGHPVEVKDNKDTLAYAYDAEKEELKLTPGGGTMIFEYSTDGGKKWSKVTKDVVIKKSKIGEAGVKVHTVGQKEDTKKKIEANWASNELSISLTTVTISGPAEITAKDGGAEGTYTAEMKDTLTGKKIDNAEITLAATGMESEKVTFAPTTGKLTVAADAKDGKVTITATSKDGTVGTLEVTIKAKPVE